MFSGCLKIKQTLLLMRNRKIIAQMIILLHFLQAQTRNISNAA